MSDSDQHDRSDGPQNSETKTEDPNAPINIKVRLSALACQLRVAIADALPFYRTGRLIDGRGGFLQNQTEHEAEQASGGVRE